MFSDPYKNSIDQERIDKMIHLSKIYFGEDDPELHNEDTKLPKDSNDGFIDDEDPDWFRKDYPNLRQAIVFNENDRYIQRMEGKY